MSMKRSLKRVLRGEKGSVLSLALGAILIGGLWALPAIRYADANLTQHQVIDRTVKGTYAAEAGLENVLWYLRNGLTPPADPITVNGMEVTTTYQGNGGYTLYLGEMIGTTHPEWINLTASIVPDGAPDVYLFTITVTWQPGSGAPTIHLEEIGTKLPPGYTYVPGSADTFPGNLSDDEPDITEDDEWLVVDRQDIGLIGDITGSLYVITSTARLPGTTEVTGKIIAGVIVNEAEVYVASWQIVR
jgi:hypothetical protein